MRALTRVIECHRHALWRYLPDLVLVVDAPNESIDTQTHADGTEGSGESQESHRETARCHVLNVVKRARRVKRGRREGGREENGRRSSDGGEGAVLNVTARR